MMTTNPIPSQVWIGSQSILKQQALEYLQRQFCQNNYCQTCFTCLQIQQGQSANLLWLTPQGNYKLEQIQPVLDRLSYRLGQDEQFYFIFQDAQYLSPACANSLLKSIEEPPLGYHFIFLSTRKELILPTILSRSTIIDFGNESSECQHPLYRIFTSSPGSAWEFSQVLDQQTELNEQLSYEILESVYHYWLKQYQAHPDTKLLSQINVIQLMLQTPPMPGSSKLFWRELFLRFFS